MSDSELSAIAHYELVMGMEREMPELKGIAKFVLGKMKWTKSGELALKRYVKARTKIAADLAQMMEERDSAGGAKTPATALSGVEPRTEGETGLCRAAQPLCRATAKGGQPA